MQLWFFLSGLSRSRTIFLASFFFFVSLVWCPCSWCIYQIDKRVTTPYWDFTIEGEEIYRAGWGPKALVHVSKMFSDEW